MAGFYILGISFTILFLLFLFSKYYKSLAVWSLLPIFVMFIGLIFTFNYTGYQRSIINDYVVYSKLDYSEYDSKTKMQILKKIEAINEYITYQLELKDNWFAKCFAKEEIYNLKLIELNI